MNYIFDVDGTLTPSRRRIDSRFAAWFERFATHNCVYLVTGSDREKTIEQIGEPLYNLAYMVYNCSGNSVWQQNRNVKENDWQLPNSARKWLLNELDSSRFYRKTGLHIEERPGMVNFSIVGRNCNIEDRAMYRQWDEHKSERKIIAEKFRNKFGLEAQVAGETGIDIYPVGADKSQVAEWVEKPITFFGDSMQFGGNDYPLARALEKYKDCKSIQVKDWKDTFEILTGEKV